MDLSLLTREELFDKGLKLCSGPCSEIKSHAEFSKHSQTWDLKRPRCKVCISEEEKVKREKAKKRKPSVKPTDTQRCRGECGQVKQFKDFDLRTDSKTGYRYECVECRQKSRSEYYQDNKEVINQKQKTHYEENKEKILARDKIYYKNNKERINKRNQEYHHNNRERMLEANRRWREANPSWHKEYRKKNKDYYRDKCAERRAKLVNQFVEPVNRWVLYEIYEGCCGICGEQLDSDNFAVDHIIPISKGGLHMYKNTQCACLPCNQKKSNLIYTPDQLAIIPPDSAYEDLPKENYSAKTALSGIWWREKSRTSKNRDDK